MFTYHGRFSMPDTVWEKFSTTSTDRFREAEAWCEQNLEYGDWSAIWERNIYIKSSTGAMTFRMRWC